MLLPIFDPLCSSYFGPLTVKSAQWDRPAAYCPAHPLIPSSPPSLLHASSITQIQMFDCRLYLTFGMSLYFHISPVTFPLSHFHHAVTHPSTPRRKGGKGGKKKTLLSPLPYNHSCSIFVHCLTQPPHLSPFTLHPRHPPAPHSFDLLE